MAPSEFTEEKPSLRVALREAKEHIPRNPQTNQPYPYWGFFAPDAAFKRLGADVFVYMRFLQEVMVVAVVSSLLMLWPMLHNIQSAGPLSYGPWAITSIGMSDRVIATNAPSQRPSSLIASTADSLHVAACRRRSNGFM